MPANRSRTLEWRRCLQQLCERGGALEIAVDDRKPADDSRHLVWRVRLLEIGDGEIVVEPPFTLGHVIRLHRGVELVAFLAVGQNRWTFRTTLLGQVRREVDDRRPVDALRLALPEKVERCQRRNHYRMHTGTLSLPEVEVWPLLDPKSVLIAERANELRFQDDGGRESANGATEPNDSIMPEVGPRFNAMLLNIGGGGVGLRVEPDDAQALARHKLFWLRFRLPTLPTAICATGKLVHTNVDSTQHTYAGMAFDFSFNPGHQRFVVEQITRYITTQQRNQLDRPPRSDAA